MLSVSLSINPTHRKNAGLLLRGVLPTHIKNKNLLFLSGFLPTHHKNVDLLLRGVETHCIILGFLSFAWVCFCLRTAKMRVYLFTMFSLGEQNDCVIHRAKKTALRIHFCLLRQKPLVVHQYNYRGFFLICVCFSTAPSICRKILFRQTEAECCSASPNCRASRRQSHPRFLDKKPYLVCADLSAMPFYQHAAQDIRHHRRRKSRRVAV